MKAAVLHKLGTFPRYEDFPDPQSGNEEVVIHVKRSRWRTWTRL